MTGGLVTPTMPTRASIARLLQKGRDLVAATGVAAGGFGGGGGAPGTAPADGYYDALALHRALEDRAAEADTQMLLAEMVREQTNDELWAMDDEEEQQQQEEKRSRWRRRGKEGGSTPTAPFKKTFE